MRAIEATLDVDAEGRLTLELPEELPYGHHPVLLVFADVDEDPLPEPHSPIPHPIVSAGGWPAGFTVSRSQLYDDDDG